MASGPGLDSQPLGMGGRNLTVHGSRELLRQELLTDREVSKSRKRQQEKAGVTKFSHLPPVYKIFQ